MAENLAERLDHGLEFADQLVHDQPGLLSAEANDDDASRRVVPLRLPAARATG